MKLQLKLDSVYVPSQDIVSREIEGELIIVPLVSGIGDMENELYTLNQTGKAVWEKLDGRKCLKDIAKELNEEFEASEGEIQKDVVGLVQELFKRKMVVEVSVKHEK
jgi:hypothetical protein